MGKLLTLSVSCTDADMSISARNKSGKFKCIGKHKHCDAINPL